MTRDLATLPKVDLHVHLEGSIRPSTVRQLAERHRAGIPPGLLDDGWVFADFSHFLSQYFFVCSCLNDAEDFHRIAYEFCEDEAAGGARYAEVTFTAASHALRFGGEWDMAVESVLAGFADGERDFGVRCRLVLDHVRGFPLELAEQTLAVALRHRPGVVSLGLGGDERHPPEPYAPVFERARAEGLHSVPHAGEAAGAASIRSVLVALGAERIGHGFRCLDEPALVDLLRERAVPLEVCPTSNVATGLIPNFADHPLPALMAAGLTVTLNSDDPGMFASPLLGEYEKARDLWGFDDATLATLAANGVRASFMDDAAKAALTAEIGAWLS